MGFRVLDLRVLCLGVLGILGLGGLGCKGFRVLELRLVMFGASLVARDCGRRRSCTTKVFSGARFPPSVRLFCES